MHALLHVKTIWDGEALANTELILQEINLVLLFILIYKCLSSYA
jgi:hypothetical protein